MLPKGAELIENKVSGAPGIKMDNVYVMAGVPSILKSMLEAIIGDLQYGEVIHSESISCQNIPESEMAPILENLEKQYCHLEIGSYPRLENGVPSLNVVVRSKDINQLAAAASELQQIVNQILVIKQG
jgi:molybdopterin-biosynthesis enzyme MoeA-like protein